MMKLIKESLNEFERGLSPRKALKIGYIAYYPYAFKNFENWIYKYANSPEYNTNISDVVNKCFIGKNVNFKPDDEQYFELKEKLIFKGHTISEIHNSYKSEIEQVFEDYKYLHMLFF